MEDGRSTSPTDSISRMTTIHRRPLSATSSYKDSTYLYILPAKTAEKQSLSFVFASAGSSAQLSARETLTAVWRHSLSVAVTRLGFEWPNSPISGLPQALWKWTWRACPELSQTGHRYVLPIFKQQPALAHHLSGKHGNDSCSIWHNTSYRLITIVLWSYVQIPSTFGIWKYRRARCIDIWM
jgi:hypothetical protein